MKKSLGIIILALSAAPAWCQSACPPNLITGPFAAPLTNCFTELLNKISELEKTLKGIESRQALPVGTILTSYLQAIEFAESIGESEGSSLDKRTWVLADGREVIGTRFAVLTRGKRIPDLRGMFLRGLAVGDGRAAGDLQESATALPKTTNFTGVTSATVAPTSSLSAEPSGVGDKYNAGGKDYIVITAGQPRPVQPHSHTVSITAGGDEETRPKNVAVNFYIRIN